VYPGPELVRVVTSAESAACDATTIAAGIPARVLMNRAGAAAAGEIARRCSADLARGALVLAGPGNNGGDAWVIARALAAAGVRVRVVEPMGAKSPDCIAERALAVSGVEVVPFEGVDRCYDGEGVVVDGLLGTGASGTPRDAIAACLHAVARVRERGAVTVAIDVPSGLDATTGAEHGALPAALTITFGSIKRGHLVARGLCGAVVVVDIGLIPKAGDSTPRLIDDRWLRQVLPPIGADAHKGTRKKLAIIGGAQGMAGAVILAARAALRSGIGMVRAVVHPESLAALQQAEPAALASTWTSMNDALHEAVIGWADAVVIGPGLGRSDDASRLLTRILAEWHGPTVLDADALNAFAGDPERLGRALGDRQALLTPHPMELGRLIGCSVDDVLATRFEIGADVARRCRATVLLKGVPTVISDGRRAPLVAAVGTPALATGGSGDVLSGIAGTIVAHVDDPLVAAGVAACVHGRAAELSAGPDARERAPWRAASEPTVRGTALDDVIGALREVWTTAPRVVRYPVLAELPRVAAG
jgi:NAD(P)H-hydrate epimerase